MNILKSFNQKSIIAIVLITGATSTQMMSPSQSEAATIYSKYTFAANTPVLNSTNQYSTYHNLLPATKVKGTVIGSYLKLTYPTQFKGKYIQRKSLVTTAPNAKSGYTLYPGYNGIKVYYLQKALGLPSEPYYKSKMDNNTVNAVRRFQTKNGLRQTGIVTKATWDKLKTGKPFNIDTWQKPSDVSINASRYKRIETMITYAKKQIGQTYIWGSTGEPETAVNRAAGFDCSGLILQGMRAGGFNPKGITNFANVRPQSDLANELWKNNEFSRVSLNALKRGDLVFYLEASGRAGHVSLYLGNNKILHSLGSAVYTTDYAINGYVNKFGFTSIGAKRPFK